MITPLPNTLIPQHVFVDPETKKEWLYFHYDGTYQEYKQMPKGLLKDGKHFIKMSHNSDTFLVAYRETPKSEIVFIA